MRELNAIARTILDILESSEARWRTHRKGTSRTHGFPISPDPTSVNKYQTG